MWWRWRPHSRPWCRLRGQPLQAVLDRINHLVDVGEWTPDFNDEHVLLPLTRVTRDLNGRRAPAFAQGRLFVGGRLALQDPIENKGDGNKVPPL